MSHIHTKTKKESARDTRFAAHIMAPPGLAWVPGLGDAVVVAPAVVRALVRGEVVMPPPPPPPRTGLLVVVGAEVSDGESPVVVGS
jgi:hypothetical protein